MKTDFTGLSAFPLTPLRDDTVDEAAFAGLISRLDAAGVDSITALGSTGSYAYLSPNERARVAQLAVENARRTPVFIGVGSLRTSHVLANIDRAADAGAAGVLLAPVTYQPLTEHDVFELYRTVTEHTDLPVIVYDNPRTTHFTFTTDLYARIAQLPGIASIKIPGIASIKIPGVPTDSAAAREHIASIRAAIPAHVSIGVSGDPLAAAGLNAGCDAWYSVIAGTLPHPALAITRAALEDQPEKALELSAQLEPLWQLFNELGGSIRVTAAIAEHLGLTGRSCLPLPLQGLSDQQRARVIAVVDQLGSRLDKT